MRKLLYAAVALFGAVAAQAQEKVVNVYNWSDYIDARTLDEFTRETGIKVVYDTYDSNEILETKLLAGKTGYDVVSPSASFLQRQIQAGVYQKLDFAKLPNAKGLWPEINARLAVYDPGNQHAVDYMWFTTGIAFNVRKAKERIGDAQLDSWDMIFKPENLRKFADCGVYVLDSPEDLFTTALNWLKLKPDSKNAEDIRRAADLLVTMKRNVKKFHSSEYINALANGDICLAVGWAGDSFQARDRAHEANNGVEIDFVIPREGTLISLDSFAIPKDAPHVAEAHAFIDFMLRPEIAARNTRVTKFANGVSASKPLVDKDILANKAIYPDDAMIARLFTATSNDPATQKIVTREWTRVKTGK